MPVGTMVLFLTGAALLIVGMVMALQQGAIVEELSAAALVIFVSDAVLMTVLSAMFVILGIRLLRDKRRRTAQIAEVMIVILILVILCDMMLSGLTPDLIPLRRGAGRCSSRYRATWTRR